MSGKDYDEDDYREMDKRVDDFLRSERDNDDTLDSSLESGCLFPSECCMPGQHYTCDCHTAEMLDAYEKESRGDDISFWITVGITVVGFLTAILIV